MASRGVHVSVLTVNVDINAGDLCLARTILADDEITKRGKALYSTGRRLKTYITEIIKIKINH